MEKIVCDTMIWYELGNGDLKLNELDKVHHLIFTGCTMWELATSERMLTNPVLFKGACTSVAKYAAERNLKLPYDELLDIEASNKQIIDVYDRLEFVANNDDFNILANNDAVIKAKEAILREKAMFEQLVNFINEKAKEISTRLRNNRGTRDNHKAIENIGGCMQMVQQECNMWANLVPIGEKKVNFYNHELFIKVLDKWYKNLELGTESKMKINDWFDVYNMVYVNPGMKYWTHEKKWILLIWDSGMKDYLFIDHEAERILKKHHRI